MLFVGFSGTSVAPAGRGERNGKYKVFSTFIWTMLDVLVEIGIPAITGRVPVLIVNILKMFFFSAVVSSRYSPYQFLNSKLTSSRITMIFYLLKFTSC